MLINANSVNSVVIEVDTVANDVGICYFNPATESLMEINSANSHYLSLKPLEKTILKYYLVVNAGVAPLDYVKISIVKDNIEDYYYIKTIIGNDIPVVADFDVLPDFNSFRVNNPVSEAFIPVWFLVSSLEQINSVLTFKMEIEYD